MHISEKTLGFLNGEFEVERAYGEKREEVLRRAGLKTYFITKVLKPVSIENACILVSSLLFLLFHFKSFTSTVKLLMVLTQTQTFLS